MTIIDRIPAAHLRGLAATEYAHCYEQGWRRSRGRDFDLGCNPYGFTHTGEAKYEAWEDGYLDQAVRPDMKWVTPLLGYDVATNMHMTPEELEEAYRRARRA